MKDKDSTLWLLQHLGFVINWKKSFTSSPVHETPGFCNQFHRDEAFLATRENVPTNPGLQGPDLRKECLSENSFTIYWETSTMKAVFPAPLHYRHLQMLQVKEYNSVVLLNKECRSDHQWWIDQLSTWNGRLLISPALDLIITTDASLKDWEAECQRVHTRGLWTQEESLLCINALELRADFFALRAFSKNRKKLHIHLRMDNRTAVAYLLKMGGTRSRVLVGIAQDLWEYTLRKGISLTAEYLAGEMNHEADWQSRHFRDSSNWKLNPKVFQFIQEMPTSDSASPTEGSITLSQ